MPQPDRSLDPAFCALLLDNHHKLVGTRLEPDGMSPTETARWLYHDAPFGVLAHDTAADPVFTYANETAQRAFGYDWAEFTALPSRLSAGPQDRAERQVLLDGVARDGYVSGYRGLRVAKSGRQFWIEDVTVWNLLDARGGQVGQAAAYRRFTPA
ncbi:MAG TPA: MEKHLA domain-containing protein [Pseudonocardiaceae bacterium]|jgi:hypothetical protein|nr:MEKHLA domain-containing protein [Pseudonocardiaceae bacterium]